jgi:hypothetical protein
LLESFWGVEQSLAWRKRYEDGGITQSPKNYLSLNHQLHFWFDNARFALKPLFKSPDGTEVTVQWHWLKRTSLLPKTAIDPTEDVLAQAGLTDRSWGECLAHRKSGVPIRTGQTFVIRAENPEELPSFELLKLQWNLLRVAAICGAADVTDDYYEGDEDDCGQQGTVIADKNETAAAGQGKTVTAGQYKVVAEAVAEAITKPPESDQTGSPPEQTEQIEQTEQSPTRDPDPQTARGFRNG